MDESYDPNSAAPTGKLNVTIEPADVAIAAVEANRGQWREQGASAWKNSGDLLPGLPVGAHVIEFKAVPGRATPPLQNVQVKSGSTVATAGTYLLADPTTGDAVTAVADNTVTSTEPYVYMGQILTDTGAGSGFAVLDRTVLTAAHVLFDDVNLTYAAGQRWYLQRTPGGVQGPPQFPRGAYVFDGYASQRSTDRADHVLPGTSTPGSQNFDVAALYFEEPAARHGSGGFVRSDARENEWLRSGRAKMLLGYPVDGVAGGKLGRLHASRKMSETFDLTYNDPRFSRVYSTQKIRGFPGCSGGRSAGCWKTAAFIRPPFTSAAAIRRSCGPSTPPWSI